jgi:hypothetical protein
MDQRQRRPIFRFHPSNMPAKPTTTVRLVLHVEVDYVHKQGLGIGIVEQAERMVVDGAKRARASQASPTTEQKYSVKGGSFRAENVKTEERAYMLALLHALGIAYETVKKNGTEESSHVDEVVIATSSSTVVETVNHHIQNAPESLEQVTKMNDRLMIGRVVEAVKKKLFRRGVNVAFIAVDEPDTTAARGRARTLARQRGSKACRSRRQRMRAQNDDLTEDLAKDLNDLEVEAVCYAGSHLDRTTEK